MQGFMSKTKSPTPGLGLEIKPLKKNARLMYGGSTPSIPDSGRVVHSLGEILDQRETSACTGFSGGQFIQSHPWFTSIGSTDAERYRFCFELYRLAQRLDETPGEEPEYFGSSLEGLFKAMQSLGFVSGEPSWTTDTDAIIRCLFERGPVIVGTPWLAGMDNPDEHAIIKPTGASRGGHAYIVYGADLDFEENEEELFMASSWGEKFGNNGRVRMTVKDFAKLLRTGGYGVSILEK